MPSLMIHLLTAQQCRQDPTALFYVGSVAPDAVEGWKEKDKSHFRDLPYRAAALRALAKATDPADDFAEAVLLHLFLDWKWDGTYIAAFQKAHGADWFLPYRAEIGAVSARLYHMTNSRQVWQSMADLDPAEFGHFNGTNGEQIHDLILRSHDFHQNNPDMPGFYTFEQVFEFIEGAAREYGAWRQLTMDN